MNSNIKRVLVIVLTLTVALSLLTSGVKEYSNSKQLAARGKTTSGEVLGGDRIVNGRLSPSNCHLQIKFATEDHAWHQDRLKVSQDVYDETQIGDSIEVHYLPENPSVCQVGKEVQLQYNDLFSGSVVLAIALCLIAFVKKPEAKIASHIGKQFEMLSLEKHEHISVDAKKFRHLDLSYYDLLQRSLETKGFRYVDDQENVTLRQRNGIHVFIRVLLKADGVVEACIYHYVPKLKLRLLGGRSSKVLDLTTWFTDGTFVCSSNAEGAAKFSSPPSISRLYMPAVTTWNVLLEAHERRVREYLETNPDVSPRKSKSMADVHRAWDEIQRIKSEFRRRNGLSKIELSRLTSLPGESVDEIHGTLTDRRERGL